MPHLGCVIGPQGPLLNVSVTVSAQRLQALTVANQTPPQPVPARLLVDTGASHTAIDARIFPLLGLTPRGTVAVHTPSTQGVPHNVNQYDVGLGIFGATAGFVAHFLPTLSVTDGHFQVQGHDGLIGRDILALCRFYYDGTTNNVSLSF